MLQSILKNPLVCIAVVFFLVSYVRSFLKEVKTLHPFPGFGDAGLVFIDLFMYSIIIFLSIDYLLIYLERTLHLPQYTICLLPSYWKAFIYMFWMSVDSRNKLIISIGNKMRE